MSGSSSLPVKNAFKEIKSDELVGRLWGIHGLGERVFQVFDIVPFGGRRLCRLRFLELDDLIFGSCFGAFLILALFFSWLCFFLFRCGGLWHYGRNLPISSFRSFTGFSCRRGFGSFFVYWFNRFFLGGFLFRNRSVLEQLILNPDDSLTVKRFQRFWENHKMAGTSLCKATESMNGASRLLGKRHEPIRLDWRLQRLCFF